MTVEITPVDQAVLRVSVLTWMTKRLKVAVDEAREQLAAQMRKGDTLAARSPLDDTRIGRVSMSDPKSRATFTDREAAVAWVRLRYPEKQVGRWEITGLMSEAMAVLREHAPHLVSHVESVPDWALSELLTKSEVAGQPAGFSMELGDAAPPGIAVSLPDGVLTVRLDSMADAAVPAMWDAHLVDMDGNLRQIEGAP